MKDARAQFDAQRCQHDPITMHFLDECGVHHAMTPAYARAPRGERAYASRPGRKGRHVSVLGAMSSRDGLSVTPWLLSVDGFGFAEWIAVCLVPRLRPGDIVVLDNASIHKNARARELIEQAGARILFLPPYSPEWNPIEEAWSKFKNALRRLAARTIDALCEAIALAGDTITHDDILGWVRHAGYAEST